MHRHLTGQFLKALLLGFLCCLGAEAKDDVPAKPKAPLLAIKEVHPKTGSLAPLVKAGTKPAPPGYILYSLPEIDRETGKKPILLKEHNLVDSDDVQLARATGTPGEISVRLTKNAGKRMQNATGKMQLGRDRMAVVLEGKCLIAPTVQAPLSSDFVITGLDSKKEVQRIVFALNAPIKKTSRK